MSEAVSLRSFSFLTLPVGHAARAAYEKKFQKISLQIFFLFLKRGFSILASKSLTGETHFSTIFLQLSGKSGWTGPACWRRTWDKRRSLSSLNLWMACCYHRALKIHRANIGFYVLKQPTHILLASFTCWKQINWQILFFISVTRS